MRDATELSTCCPDLIGSALCTQPRPNLVAFAGGVPECPSGIPAKADTLGKAHCQHLGTRPPAS